MSEQIQTVHRADVGTVAVLEFRRDDRPMNVVDENLLRDLRSAMSHAIADDAVEAIVLASGAPAFGGGADITWLPDLAARPDADEFLAGVHDLMLDLTRAPKPIIAAVNGNALGGALEIALGADEIVASDDARFGLPEVTLGLLPGGGGTQLLGRFVDLEVAADLLTSGRIVHAEEARTLGLVADVVPLGELRSVAVNRALTAVGAGRVREPRPTFADGKTSLQHRSTSSPAAAAIVGVLEISATRGLEAGLAAEREAFLLLLRSAEARARIHLFRVESEARRRAGHGDDLIDRLGVVGGGQMGAGVAATAAIRGLPVLVRDVDDAAVDRAAGYLDRVLSRSVSGVDHDTTRGCWSGTTEMREIAGADAIVEAVFELPELKRQVLSEVSAQVAGDALVATNTSAIGIGELSSAVARPERFIGMHFFSPVERMPLVELIPHHGTALATAARAAALSRRLGKVPITVGDAPGFFTSRVYARWLIEGVRLVLDGAAPTDVDAAARSVGFPVGPLQAHDEATLELVLQASIGQVAERVMSDRLDVATVRIGLEKLVESGVRGRRHGLGFYRYDQNGKRDGMNDQVGDLLGVRPEGISTQVAAERLLLAFVSECLLCWDEGTLCHPNDGDVAAVLGIGFPRSLGGPFHWVDDTGAAEVVERCRRLGTAFPVGTRVERLASQGGRLEDEPRRPAPFQDAGA